MSAAPAPAPSQPAAESLAAPVSAPAPAPASAAPAVLPAALPAVQLQAPALAPAAAPVQQPAASLGLEAPAPAPAQAVFPAAISFGAPAPAPATAAMVAPFLPASKLAPASAPAGTLAAVHQSTVQGAGDARLMSNMSHIESVCVWVMYVKPQPGFRSFNPVLANAIQCWPLYAEMYTFATSAASAHSLLYAPFVCICVAACLKPTRSWLLQRLLLKTRPQALCPPRPLSPPSSRRLRLWPPLRQ